jgi:hypothetical protein
MSLKVSCQKHPRYNGTNPPRASCTGCQAIFALRASALMARLKVGGPKQKKEVDHGV